MKINKKFGITFILILIIEILIGIFVQDRFIRPFGGDILIVILIYCLVRTFIQKKLVLLPLYVFVFAVMVEVGQYFDFIKILHLENNRLANVIIGTTFDIKDIVCYFVGCVIIMIWQIYIDSEGICANKGGN